MSEERRFPLDASFETQHLVSALVCALALASYATWITADLVARWLVFPVVVLLAGFLLLGKNSQHDQAVFLGYGMAALLALTPLFMILPDLRSAGTYGPSPLDMALTTLNVVFLGIFLAIALVIAYATFRYDGGIGILQRIRERRATA